MLIMTRLERVCGPKFRLVPFRFQVTRLLSQALLQRKRPRRKRMPEQLGPSFPALDRARSVRVTASAIWGVTILPREIARCVFRTYAASGLSAVSPFSG